MTLLDIAGLGQRLLDLVVDTAAAESVDLPARRYLTAGASGAEAWDGEQVVVGLQQLAAGNASRSQAALGQPTYSPGGASPLTSAVLRVEIVRCHPTLDDEGNPPSVDDEHAAGVQAMKDAALLHAVRGAAVTAAALTDAQPGDILAGPIQPAGPEGGLAGMSLTLTVTALRWATT